jgi:phosphoglycerate dehydrogenase-like enzyme
MTNAVVLSGENAPPMPSLDRLRERATVTFAGSMDQLVPAMPDADMMFVWDFRFGDLDDVLSTAHRLDWVHVAAVGVDRVLTPGLRERDVTLTNSRGVFDSAIAEYVAGLLLAWAKDFWGTRALQDQALWRHRLTRRLADQRVAVVGSGSIGRTIAATLAALGVSVSLVGRRATRDDQFGEIQSSDRLAEVAEASDALVLAAPLTEATRHMVDARVLANLGPDGYLVNVGRGQLVVQSELVDAVRSGTIAGAALDVFESEPLPADSPLWAMPNVLVSPHMSGDYLGFGDALVDLLVDNFDRWRAGQPLRNIVDKVAGYATTT